jgi:polysaccharide export outer membrane protein
MTIRTIIAALLLASAALAQSPAPAPTPPPNYVVNPGDVLDIVFRWTPEFNQTVTVQPDGHAGLTSAGDLKVAGLTLPEIHDAIVRESRAKLVDPEVAVILKDFERPRIAVAGEVVNPGKYDLRQPTTALQAILLAGGAKESAQMSQVLLFRPMPNGFSEVHHLSFKRLGNTDHPAEDIQLRPGDMLLIPRDKLTKIGRVIRTFNLGVYFNPASGAVF